MATVAAGMVGPPFCTAEGIGSPLTAYYPVSLDVEGRSCLVVGGGPVAARKARGLLDCGAVGDGDRPRRLRRHGGLTPLTIDAARTPPGEAGGYRLVVTATGIPAVDGAVYADAEAAGVWVNSADDSAHCSFILPSVHRDGAVTIAVSTGGPARRSPRGCAPGCPRSADRGWANWPSCWAGPARLHEPGGAPRRSTGPPCSTARLPGLVREGRRDEARALVEAATGTLARSRSDAVHGGARAAPPSAPSRAPGARAPTWPSTTSTLASRRTELLAGPGTPTRRTGTSETCSRRSAGQSTPSASRTMTTKTARPPRTHPSRSE